MLNNQRVYSMDWCNGNLTGKFAMFDGENHGISG
jgi:hypothetical protein